MGCATLDSMSLILCRRFRKRKQKKRMNPERTVKTPIMIAPRIKLENSLPLSLLLFEAALRSLYKEGGGEGKYSFWL